MRYLGVDIGGTKIAAGIVDENFHILAEETVPTDVAGGPNAITADIVRAVRAACAQAGTCVEAFPYVGIGCAGTIDAKAGVVKYANNLHFESDVSLAAPVAAALGRPVYLENDANCAGLGEFLALEEHRRIQSFVMITLGTGIGSACVIDGKLYRGFNGAAPELGHCIIEAAEYCATAVRADAGKCIARVIRCAIRRRSLRAGIRKARCGRRPMESLNASMATRRLRLGVRAMRRRVKW